MWERRDNVESVFKLKDADSIRGKHVLIVDDVVTTGSTIIACAKELLKAGDVRISILALGHANPRAL
jgi:predicted amidophosphoribosyltransferase